MYIISSFSSFFQPYRDCLATALLEIIELSPKRNLSSQEDIIPLKEP